MPTAITHQILAEEVYKELPPSLKDKIISPSHYYLGAQGCDVGFTYRIFHRSPDNFGRFLHANQPLLFFKILWEESQKSQEVFSYACGYLTHYAADTVFHPYVYKQIKQRGIFSHHAVEHAFDGALLRIYRKGEGLFFYRLPQPSYTPRGLRNIYKVYARYARESGWGKLNLRSFCRSVKHYYIINRVRTPLFRKKYATNAQTLFTAAQEESVRLIKVFQLQKGGALPAEDFGKHYLTGKIAQKK